MQTRRHAPLGRRRAHFVQGAQGRWRHTDLHRGRIRLVDIHTGDRADARRSGHYRWLLSTCLAAAVGAIAIAVIIASYSDMLHYGLPSPPYSRVDGLRWAISKTDKLPIANGVVAARFDIADAARQRRDRREYILEKTYHRLVARLAPISQAHAEAVPPLDPIALFRQHRRCCPGPPLEPLRQPAPRRPELGHSA